MSEMPPGLTDAEVTDRVRDGRVNRQPDPPGRSFRNIIRANVLTPVNLIMGTLLVLILVAGHPGDALFAGVIVSNSVIGVVQELRAKQALAKLEVLNAPRARVRRNGVEIETALDQVVLDDVLVLAPGDQVVVDAEVVSALGLEMDESLLTGESDAVDKNPGDEVLSGSFVVAGSGIARATRVGSDAYASSLAEEARRFVLVNSELRAGVDLILRWLTWIIPPVGGLLLWSLLSSDPSWQDALQGTVAAAVAMVPDGLVLLTSIAFIVGILSLARHKALARELASVELLARVDVLCLDKTGTITTGDIAYADLDLLDEVTDPETVRGVLADLAAADPAPNATLAAIERAHPDPTGRKLTSTVPFSSARKWASTSFDDGTTWFLGAPDILLPGGSLERVEMHTAKGQRVVALAHGSDPADEVLPPDLVPTALVVLEDEIRSDAGEILTFLTQQGIELRVISGDHPATVAAVAERAGVPGASQAMDARDLSTDESALADELAENVVFGRVTPHQKQAMVRALQAREHIVAMTGDGVNDVLALKDADMGIAMGSGSAATRSVAQITLLDNRFSTLPVVLAEGRRVINNIERVANLFVVKATYAVMMAALTGLLRVPFPFLPRQLTLLGTFSIGVPGFVLALAPNTRRAATGFVIRVLRFSVPAGAIAGSLTFAVFEIARRHDDVSLAESRTSATLVLLGIGLVILALLARPFRWAYVGLIAAMFAAYAAALGIEPIRDYFRLDSPPLWMWTVIGATVVVSIGLLVMVARRSPWHDTAGQPEEHP